jgi:hypothetical protein
VGSSPTPGAAKAQVEADRAVAGSLDEMCLAVVPRRFQIVVTTWCRGERSLASSCLFSSQLPGSGTGTRGAPPGPPRRSTFYAELPGNTNHDAIQEALQAEFEALVAV